MGKKKKEQLRLTLQNFLRKRIYHWPQQKALPVARIAEQITSVPGASAFFKGSVVSYATSVKIEVLKVPEEMIKEFSVVSGEVAKAMAKNVKRITGADFGVATTGNAGPTKGDSDADIGTVFIALATPDRVFVEQFIMGNHRRRIVQKSVHRAFQMLQKEILKF